MPHRTDTLSDWSEAVQPAGGGRFLLLRCSNDIADQVERALGLSREDRVRVAGPDRGEWTHRIPLRRPLSDDEKELLRLLQAVVTLRLAGPFEVAIALDRYKDPSSSEDSLLWKNTPIGQLFHDAKYRGDGKAGKALAREMHRFIAAHPAYAAAQAIVAAPSHTEVGFSERLVRATGRLASLPVTVASEVDAKPGPVKGLDDAHRTPQHFSVEPEAVRGLRVIVVDDMVRTGGTLVAVGQAVAAAGAGPVVGLAAVRTMRN